MLGEEDDKSFDEILHVQIERGREIDIYSMLSYNYS